MHITHCDAAILRNAPGKPKGPSPYICSSGGSDGVLDLSDHDALASVLAAGSTWSAPRMSVLNLPFDPQSGNLLCIR